jgi:hypothetical protein
MIRVFLSYRRSDIPEIARRIYEYLADKLGVDSVFRDDRDKVSYDMRRDSRFAPGDILLVVMGGKWFQELVKRQQSPDERDYVLEEIETALRADDVTVIPLLIDDEAMPPISMLPRKIMSLSQRVAQPITKSHFVSDMEKLLRRIRHQQERFSSAIRVRESLPLDELKRRIQRSSGQVKILCTWIAKFDEMSDSLVQAVQNDCKVRILLLHPETECAVQRSRDLAEDDSFAASKIYENIDGLKRLCTAFRNRKGQSNLRLRLYNTIPGHYLHIIDDYMLLGSYSVGVRASESPQIEVEDSNSELYCAMSDYFDAVWESASNIDLIDEELKKLEPVE